MTGVPPTRPSGGYLALLEAIRQAEVERILPLLGRTGRLLEVGAGTGWQARFLAERGFAVEAIDVATSDYLHAAVWPVTQYDGHHLPMADESVDVVFSSNVLEHIPHVEVFQREILRVLRPGGVAVHAMPSATWRLWTCLAHLPWLVREWGRRQAGSQAAFRVGPTEGLAADTARASRPKGVWSRLRWLAVPRHGEIGNTLTELWLFSRPRWRALFQRAGFREIQAMPLGLYYTGYLLSGDRGGLARRQRLAGWLGSSCVVYVMRRPN